MMQQACGISWQGHLPEITTDRLTLRPVREKNLANYQALFANAVAMKHYIRNVRTPEQTATRFQGWLDRWKVHPFSALAIYRKQGVDKTSEKPTEEFVGHAVLGHGDYEGDPEHGFSEAAIIITPEYWNVDFADKKESETIGKAGMKGIGTEVKKAIQLFTKELVEKKMEVPVDVTEEQQEEVKKLLDTRKLSLCMRDDETKKIKAVFVPFTEVRVSCSKQNSAMVKMLGHIVEGKLGKAEDIKGDASRQLVKISLESSESKNCIVM